MDTARHIQIFNPNLVTGRIAIIGVGAIGSALAINLAKLGLGGQLSLFDDDIVEAHNISNQFLYGTEDIGQHKAVMASLMISRLTDHSHRNMPYACTFKVTARNELQDIRYVFMCVDNMAARKNIAEKCIRYNPDIHYFADARMDAWEGIVYGFDPRNIPKINDYIGRMYPDEDVPVNRGGCSITQSIGATAMTLACQMTWNFIDHLSGNNPPEEIALRVPNLAVHTKGMLDS